MKIGVVSNLWTPYARGGAEELMTQLAETYVKQGHQIVVFTLDASDSITQTVHLLADTDKPYKITRHPIHNFYDLLDDWKQPYWKKILWHTKDAFNLPMAKKFQTWLSEEKPNALVLGNLQGLGRNVLMHTTEIPTTLILHDVQWLEPSGLLYSVEQLHQLPQQLWQAVMRYWWQTANQKKLFNVVCASEQIATWYTEAFDVSIDVLPNPMPNGAHTLPPATGPCTIGFLGQLAEHKGIQHLITAAEQLPDIQFDIAGDGPLKDLVISAETRLPNVHYHGKIPNSARESFLSQIDLLWTKSAVADLYPERVAWAFGRRTLSGSLSGQKNHMDHFTVGLPFRPATPGWVITSEADLLPFLKAFETHLSLFREQNFTPSDTTLISLDTYARRLLFPVQE